MGILLCRPVCLLPIRKIPSFIRVVVTKMLQQLHFVWMAFVIFQNAHDTPSADTAFRSQPSCASFGDSLQRHPAPRRLYLHQFMYVDDHFSVGL
jgi:hypothetical protein